MLAPNHELEAIKRRALEIAADLDRKLGPYRAEIVPNVEPQWGMLRTAPGQENKAADYLEHRGIGVFVPQFQKGSRMNVRYTELDTGRLRTEVVDLSDKLIFPGRVLVFCWDVMRHWGRIMRCPGVQAIMVDGREQPVVIPDKEIARIQVLQYVLAISRGKRRKRYASAEEKIIISTRSFWHVDGKERNRLLDEQLSAPCSLPPSA